MERVFRSTYVLGAPNIGGQWAPLETNYIRIPERNPKTIGHPHLLGLAGIHGVPAQEDSVIGGVPKINDFLISCQNLWWFAMLLRFGYIELKISKKQK